MHNSKATVFCLATRSLGIRVPPGRWGSFVAKADNFMQKTEEHALQGVNPGGYYQAVWCRDASYILRDWSLSGNVTGALQQLYFIWSHQIVPGREKIVYGRGSPDMKFLSEEADGKKQKEFAGALPTTIYQAGFSEVYAKNPDIDSTALMISTTSRILLKALGDGKIAAASKSKAPDSIPTVASESSSDYVSALMLKLGITNPGKATDFLIPRMMRAVNYLDRRDVDNDGLVEQDHNEDWMDTVMRSGKIVYSQACWIMALKNLSALLRRMERPRDARRIDMKAKKVIEAVEEHLWEEDVGCYMDIQEKHHLGTAYRTLTQDVSLYLVAITETTPRNYLGSESRIAGWSGRQAEEAQVNTQRANLALDTMKTRLWKEKWPLVTEAELKTTGPWVLKPYQYHNHTFWPWTTGIEMLARGRYDRVQDCDTLISTLTSGTQLHIHTFYEWINPITGEGKGAYPFRTGISAVRVAIVDMFQKIKSELSPSASESA